MSPYSYLSAMRIEQEAARRGVAVRWRPFLLGPIFSSQGWNTSPFAIYPAKGRYMWRDVERRAARLGLSFRRPSADDPRAFPQHSVLAARMALCALEEPWGVQFCRDVFLAEFVDERDISDQATLELLAIGSLPRHNFWSGRYRLRTRNGYGGMSTRRRCVACSDAPSFTVRGTSCSGETTALRTL